MYMKKINKDKTYCFRCSTEEREMMKYIQGKIDLPYELRKKVKEIYTNLMGIKQPKAGDPDDVYG